MHSVHAKGFITIAPGQVESTPELSSYQGRVLSHYCQVGLDSHLAGSSPSFRMDVSSPFVHHFRSITW